MRALTLLLAGSLCVAAADEAEIVDRIAAVVVTPSGPQSGWVITLSRLTFEARLHLIEGDCRTTAITAPLDNETLRGALTVLLGERLAYDQADLLQVADVDPRQEQQVFDAFTRCLDGPEGVAAFLAQQGMRESDLRASFHRQLRVKKYFELNPSFDAKPTPAEVERYADENAVKLRMYVDPDRAAEAAIDGATAEKQQRLEVPQFRQLYSHAKVRIVDRDFAGAEAPFLPVDGGS